MRGSNGQGTTDKIPYEILLESYFKMIRILALQTVDEARAGKKYCKKRKLKKDRGEISYILKRKLVIFGVSQGTDLHSACIVFL